MIEWNYRVFQEEDGDYIVRETFYDEQGQIMSCTRGGVEPVGSSLEELAEQIDAFRQALSLPVLTLADVPQDDVERAREPKQNNVSHEQVMAELGLSPQPPISAEATQKKTHPQEVQGGNLLRFAGTIPHDDILMMQRAIQEDCERIDLNEW